MDSTTIKREFELLQHIPMGVFVLRGDYTIVFWNNCLEEWTGISQNDVLDTHIFEHCPRLNTPSYTYRLEDLFEGGPPVVFSSQLHKQIIPSCFRDGRLRIQHTTVTSIPTAQEKERYALFVIEDVTDLSQQIKDYRALRDQAMKEIEMRKWAEEAFCEAQVELEERVEQRTLELKKAHTENDQLLKAITSILISVDEKDRIVQWNTAAEKVFGISKAEVMGQTLPECNIQWDCDKITEAINLCKNHKKTIPLDDILFKRPDGTDGFLGLTINPVIGKEKKQLSILVFGADITKRKIMEAQLGEAQKLEAIGQLASGIAHEINTPTQYVGDNTQFLKEGFDDFATLLEKYNRLLKATKQSEPSSQLVSEIEEALEAVDLDYLTEEIPNAIQQSLEGVERVTSIVRAMKEFAHPGSKEKTLTDINRAIESTVTVARNEWKYVAEMKTDFADDLPEVSCLPGEFNQVILNIVVNAAHAISETIGNGGVEKGVITISTHKAGDWAEIRISDTGPGIPEKIRSKIFNAFFTTKGVGKGSGQGLAISHSVIVDKHGGELTFETEIGKGTTFIIRLPITSELEKCVQNH